MFGYVFNAILGAAVWGLANVVYYDMKRKGVRNFGRFAAFWVGIPTTWITLFAVREQRQPTFQPQGEDELLAEIRRDRALRPAVDDAETPPDASDAGAPEAVEDGSSGTAM